MIDDERTLSTDESLDQEIVSYLDGELDAAEATRVERRLADDPAYRARLTRLQKAWDLLDTLGRTEADDNFTHSTVAMVALKAEDESAAASQSAKRQRNLVRGGVALAVLAAAIGAYWIVRNQLDQPNQELVRDLPVIERVDEYRNIENVEFLQRLQKEGLFAAEVDDAL